MAHKIKESSKPKISIAFYLTCIFAVMTVFAFAITILKISAPFVFPFLVIYVLFTFILLILFPIIGFWNARYYGKATIKSKLLKFVVNAIGLFFTLHLMLMVFAPLKINLFRECLNATSLALGLSFIDVVLTRRQAIRGEANDQT